MPPYTQGQLDEIEAGVRPIAAKRSVTFDGGNSSGALSAKSVLSTALTGPDNDIDFTAHAAGLAGNAISIQYVVQSQPGEALRVKVSGNSIIVRLTTAVSAEKAQGLMTSDATSPDTGGTFTIDGVTYTFRTALTEAHATGVITSNNTNVSDGDTVVVGGVTYRFKTVPIAIGDIFIGIDADTSLGSLVKTINGTGLAGTDYFAGTTTPDVNVSAGAVTSHATTLTARTLGTAGNNVTLTKSAATLTLSGLSGGKLSGGVAAIANEVLIGASAAAALDNVKTTVNGTGQGTTCSTGTVAHTTVDATTNTDTTQLFVAKTAGVAGNSIVFTENSTHIVVNGSGTLEEGAAVLGIDTTANQIITALQASTPAAALVDVALHAGNDGTGFVTLLPTTLLTGGSDGTVPLFTVHGTCLVSLRGYVNTTPAGTGGTLVHGKTGTTNDLITILTGTALTALGGIDSTGYVARGTALAKTPLKQYSDGQTIFATVATHALTAGEIDYILDYTPLTEGAYVSAT